MRFQLAVRSVSLAALVAGAAAFTSAAWAQHGHGGHGGGHGGHSGGHMGHSGVHGGHLGGHSGHIGVYGGHLGGHGGLIGGHLDIHLGGHGGGHVYSSHYGGHDHHGFHYHPWYASVGVPLYGGSYYQYYGTAAYRPVSQVVPAAQNVVVSTTTPSGLQYQSRAEEAFRAGDFDLAARMASHALVEMPRDGKLYLFASQTLLAIGDFRGSAAAIHQAAAMLDARDWGYVVENYTRYYRGLAYTQQMERLNEFIKNNPDASYAFFLRGYHQGFLGRKEIAVREFSKALELEPRDELAARMVERFGGVAPKVLPADPGAGRELRARPLGDEIPPAVDPPPRESLPLVPPK